MLSQAEKETLDTYNQIAEAWAASLGDDFWAEEYKKFAGYLPAGKILDAGGCGSGRDSLWFTANGYSVEGLDISDEMIRLAKAANPKAAFFVGSLYEMDYAKETFAGFWSACSLVHIPKRKILQILEKIKGVVKRGAVGFIAVKEGEGEKMVQWRDSGKKRFFAYYSQAEFAQLLQKAGFEILDQAKRPPNLHRQDSTFLVYYVKSS